MAFNASQLRSHLQYGGARANLFEVIMTFPSFVSLAAIAGDKFRFMCKAASLPGSNLGSIPVQYFGRTIKLPGDRTFDDWNTTIINDEDFIVRNAIEQWSNGISQFNYDTQRARNGSALLSNDYTADFVVNQYGKDGSVVKSYKFYNGFPTVVAPVEINWESSDQIEEFDTTWSYDYFETSGVFS